MVTIMCYNEKTIAYFLNDNLKTTDCENDDKVLRSYKNMKTVISMNDWEDRKRLRENESTRA